MDLAALLEQNREAILAKWFDLISRTYPQATSEFLAKQQDQFRNPVGHAISENIGPIYDQVVSAMETDELRHALDGIIRIRSVQEFTPSQAVGFIFQLKTVIRDVVDAQIQSPQKGYDLTELESRVDQVALLAFDTYTECREKLHQVQANEIRSRTANLLHRVNLKPGVSQNGGEPIDEDM
jgi:hypothetical protein